MGASYSIPDLPDSTQERRTLLPMPLSEQKNPRRIMIRQSAALPAILAGKLPMPTSLQITMPILYRAQSPPFHWVAPSAPCTTNEPSNPTRVRSACRL